MRAYDPQISRNSQKNNDSKLIDSQSFRSSKNKNIKKSSTANVIDPKKAEKIYSANGQELFNTEEKKNV